MLATIPTKLLGAASTTASANGLQYTLDIFDVISQHDIQQHLCASLPVLRKSTARERHKASEGAPTVNVVEDAVASPGQKTIKLYQTHTISIHFISIPFSGFIPIIPKPPETIERIPEKTQRNIVLCHP